jgi:dolichol-phosphate mannosyltransferase
VSGIAAPATMRQTASGPGRGLVSIVLATYNEREHILNSIAGIRSAVPPPLEIIVVDDDSPDGTWKLVADAGLTDVTLIRRVDTRGLASAFMRGIIESRGEIVGWMDADMSMPPTLLPQMIDLLTEADVVIGSRYAPGGEDVRHPLRRVSSVVINRFASLVLGHGVRDYDSGFVVLRRSVFDKVSIIPTGYGAYFIEFVYACCRKGLRVREVPYVFRDRASGVSKSLASVSRFAWLGAGYVYRIVRARFRTLD